MRKIQQRLNQIPSLPGIYKMLDSRGNIIYVGKSKCLKIRVKSYFTKAPKQSKVEKMVFFIDDIDFIVTDTHLEAQLLECQLIKELKPIFNSQMKNDKKYMYLKVGDFSQSRVLSVVPERQGDSFGPFRGRQFIQSFIDVIAHLFPIVQKNSSYEFDYHTLPMAMNPADFMKNRETLMNLFSEETSMEGLVNQLKLRMNKEATQYNYERATTYRDLIKSLTYIGHVLYDFKTFITKDILLKIPVQDGEKLFYISKGKIILKKQYTTLSQTEIDGFLDEGRNIKPGTAPDRDEKAEVDFINILFSEIQSLPNEWILN